MSESEEVWEMWDEDDDGGETIAYGFPMTQNPLDFSPDTECCTAEEIAAWEADCEAVKRGEAIKDPREGTVWFRSEDGTCVLHIDTTRWGIGTSVIRK